MRTFVMPVALVVVPLFVGCKPDAQTDGGSDAVADMSINPSDVRFDTADVGTNPSDVRFDRAELPLAVCEGRRNDAGSVFCYEENVDGTGRACIQRTCAADDGGTDLNDCCRLAV
jgi:hypothetical protein